MLMKEAAKSFRKELQSGMNVFAARSSSMPQGALDETEKWLRVAEGSRFGLPDLNDSVGSGENMKEWFANHDRDIRAAAALGAGNEVSALQYAMRDASDTAALDIAARARDLTKVKAAAGIGFNATTDLAGAVPLFDPEFRAAVERGDVRKVGEQVAKEYAAGLVTAPIVGAGAGVVQRVAPGVAAKVLPAVAGLRFANPVAVVSQLGGDAKPSARARAVDRRDNPASYGAQGPSANQQLLRAEAARQRGGRWRIGPFTLPELGITESGGLHFR